MPNQKPKPSAKRKPAAKRPALRPRAKRPDASELIKRHNTIVSLKLSGSRRSEILEYVKVQWGLQEAQADNYIAKANALIAVEAAKAREENYNEQVAFRRMLRKRAMGENDARLALDVAKDEAKILDLYPIAKYRVESWQDEIIALLKRGDITIEQVEQELGDDAEPIIIAAGARRSGAAQTQTPSGAPARAQDPAAPVEPAPQPENT